MKTTQQVPLKKRMRPIVNQRYPEFDKFHKLGASKAYYFDEVDCRDWHTRMISRMLEASHEDRHFPVFRLSHGEFIMALGYRAPRLNGRSKLYCDALTTYHAIRRFLGLEPAFRSGSDHNSWEEFSKEEHKRAQTAYMENLSKISKEGIIAAAFFDNPGFSEYFPDYFDWMDRNDIILNEQNYMPFYSIYTFLKTITLFA